LPHLLKKAAAADLPIRMRTSEGEVGLRLAGPPCRAELHCEWTGREVVRRLAFFDAKGGLLEETQSIEGKFVLLPGGDIVPVANAAACQRCLAGRPLPQWEKVEVFNRGGANTVFPGQEEASLPTRYWIGGVEHPPVTVPGDAVRLLLKCSIHQNAAFEPEALQYSLRAELGGLEVGLGSLAARRL
jgi:hypothetical protein